MSIEVDQTVQIWPHDQSSLDLQGKLFESDGCLLRAIRPKYARFYGDLLDSPTINRLFARGLVRTERSSLLADRYPLVLQHERVDFLTYWMEWPSLMLRDAAVQVCDLNIELMRLSYGIHDLHPWNVLIDFSRPVFVDFTAIVAYDKFAQRSEKWVPLIRRHWVLPLTFMAMGRPGLGRTIGRTRDTNDPIDRLFGRPLLRCFPLWYSRLAGEAQKRPEQFFRQLRQRLEKLPLATSAAGQSSQMTDGRRQPEDNAHEGDVLQDRAAETLNSLLEQLRPSTLLDIGSSTGRYSLLAEGLGTKVVAIDTDEDALNTLYMKAKVHGLNILPLVLDFMLPTPRHGRSVEYPSSTERLTCDITLLLSHLPHFIFSGDCTFERIEQLLAPYTRKYSIVEFVSAEDAWVAERMGPRFEWYSMENLVRAMGRHFRLAGIFEAESPRKLLLFERER